MTSARGYDWEWRPRGPSAPRRIEGRGVGAGYRGRGRGGEWYDREYRYRPRSGGAPRRRLDRGEEYGSYDVVYRPYGRRPAPSYHDPYFAAPSHRRAREPRRPWPVHWHPEAWWYAIGPEPLADYDWAYGSGRPERYGWTGETGRG